MTMATGVFGITLDKALDNSAAVDLDGDTLKQQLHTDTFTPNFDTHDFQNDLANEITGTGYTTGGVTAGGVTTTAASGIWTLDANDETWTTATFTARGDIWVDTTPGSSATNWLVLARTFGSDFSVTAGTFTVQQNASGVWTIDYIP